MAFDKPIGNAALAALAILTASCMTDDAGAGQPDWTSKRTGSVSDMGALDFRRIVLEGHNEARAAVGVDPLRWDDTLALQAAVYAEEMARTGRFAHSPRESRAGLGENLWRGTAGSFGPREAVAAFNAEARYFRPGAFPDVTTTGKWQDVGHYTQIIWRTTERVGCAQATGGGRDYIVCRYDPVGNIAGRQVP